MVLWGVVSSLALVSLLFVSAESALSITRPELQDAVDSLSTMLHRVRNEGLGVEALEAAIQNVSFRVTGELNLTQIEAGLRVDQLQAEVNRIVEFFNSFSANFSSGDGPSVTPIQCSSATSTGACYQGPEGTTPDSVAFGLLNGVTGLGDGSMVKFGAPDGTIISTPSSSARQQDVDSRLLRWYVTGAREDSPPREVVILMDLLPLNQEGLVNRTKEAARAIVQSLSTRDKVGVVMYESTRGADGDIVSVREAIKDQVEVEPICDFTVNEIDSFLTSFTPSPASLLPSSLARGIREANQLFSNSAESEKHLLFFTLSTLAGTVEGESYQTSLNEAVLALDAGVNLTFFNGNSFSQTVLKNAASMASGMNVHLDPSVNFLHQVSEYSVPSTFNANSPDLVVGRNNVAGQGNLLTLTRPVFNGSSFAGVLYASIPFSRMISSSQSLVKGRQLSYVFVVGGGASRLGLLHPLLPGDSLARVNVSVLEPEGVIESYLNTGNLGSGASVTKQQLFNTGSGAEIHTYAVRNVSYDYYCNTGSTMAGDFSVCLVLAEDERALRALDISFDDVRNLYNRYSAPIYHNIRYSAQDLPRCNYFCKNSVNTHISFQLTTPSAPDITETQALVNEVTSYIQSAENRPTFVEEGVAEEAAVSLAVGSFWLDNATRPSDFLTRRHLATPNGLYLTYPPTHLVSEFAPSRTEWYLTPLAHPTLLTLSPPHEDPLQEGSEVTFSLGYVVRAPPSTVNSPPFAVVSGEITRNSLRVFMDEALPACRDGSGNHECVLIDDRGNLLYRNDVNRIPSKAQFLGRDEGLVWALLGQSNNSWLMKMQCQDLFNVRIDTNRFYRVNIGENEVLSSPSEHCTSYLVQRVPGMNIFLAVYDRRRDCSSSFCFCANDACINCNTFSTSFCECPCRCSGNCDPLEENVPLCPLNVLENPNFSATTDFTPSNQDSLCFNQECQCRTNFSSCDGVRDCHWCERQQKCVQNTECCDATPGFSCCDSETRIKNLCEQYKGQCFNKPTGILPSSCKTNPSGPNGPTQPPRTSQNTAVIAGVVGGVLGLLLIVFIVALFVYYQFFRKVDPQEESSRESAFDFSNKTALSSNNPGSSEIKSKAKKEKEKEALEEKDPTPEKEQDEATL